MYLKIPLLARDASILSVMAEVATIWGFLWAFPSFIDQIRMQNLSANAESALDVCTEIEKDVEFIFREGKHDKSWNSAIVQLFVSLRDLKYRLELLENADDDIHNELKWVEEMIEVVGDKSISHDELLSILREGQKYGKVKHRGILKELKDVRAILKAIHEAPQKWQTKLVKNLFFVVFVTVTLLVLSEFSRS